MAGLPRVARAPTVGARGVHPHGGGMATGRGGDVRRKRELAVEFIRQIRAMERDKLHALILGEAGEELAQFFLAYATDLMEREPERAVENASSLLLIGYLIRAFDEPDRRRGADARVHEQGEAGQDRAPPDRRGAAARPGLAGLAAFRQGGRHLDARGRAHDRRAERAAPALTREGAWQMGPGTRRPSAPESSGPGRRSSSPSPSCAREWPSRSTGAA